jgi:hypothetical protein
MADTNAYAKEQIIKICGQNGAQQTKKLLTSTHRDAVAIL